MVAGALLTVRYSDGGEEEVRLRYGSNIIGKYGGPADIVLQAKSLSRSGSLVLSHLPKKLSLIKAQSHKHLSKRIIAQSQLTCAYGQKSFVSWEI
jgi:hypothetical protein